MNKVVKEFLDAVDTVLNSQSFFIVFDNLAEYKGQTDKETIRAVLYSEEFDQKWEAQDQERNWELFKEWKEDTKHPTQVKKNKDLEITLLKVEVANYWIDLLIANPVSRFYSPYAKALSSQHAQELVKSVLQEFDWYNRGKLYEIKPDFLFTVGNKEGGLEYLWNCGLDTISAIVSNSKIGILLTNGSS